MGSGVRQRLAERSDEEVFGVELVPVDESRARWLFELETDPSLIWRFRLGGTTPEFGRYLRMLFSPIVLDQAVVIDSARDVPIGYVYAIKHDPVSGTAEVGLLTSPEATGSGLMLLGMFLFIDRLFDRYGLRKLVGESMEFNVEQFAFTREGRFSDIVEFESVFRRAYFLDGRWWDRYQVAIHRESWSAHRETMMEVVDRILERNAERQVTQARPASGRPMVSLDSEHFTLRAVAPPDREWCQSLIESADRSGSLRYSTTPPGVSPVQHQLWAGVVCQFIIRDRANGFPMGLVTLYDVGSANLIGSVHALVVPEFAQIPGVVDEALRLFVDYVFTCWPLRQLTCTYHSDAPELSSWRRAFEGSGWGGPWSRAGVQREQIRRHTGLVDREAWVLEREGEVAG